MKRILILTAGYGEGHNSAARGVRDGLARVAPNADVDLRDLFAETFGAFHQLVRKSYLGLINRWPRSWGYVYRWLDRKKDFDQRFRDFAPVKKRLSTNLLDAFQPDVVVSVFSGLIPICSSRFSEPKRLPKNVVVVTDSITVNAIWYRCSADYFLVPNEQSAAVVRAGGIAPEMIKTFGFPVSPKFADLLRKIDKHLLANKTARVLYMINAGTRSAPELVRNFSISRSISPSRSDATKTCAVPLKPVAANRKIDIVGWTDEMPRLLCESHLLIGKAGGATVQETIAARCPMIINHIVSGQEEGNARLIVETNSGVDRAVARRSCRASAASIRR